ncbi:hypothetical protein NDU88_001430 [Pleurodeles waltl]|uniref:Uncharacterized protein n=1 Tax=Pleurodeles waltl TaxID=8319 RepID=A0AAV7NAR5_PLEWA|nr:hypothetical protein NDU88_001430 [Pleurodeles waltl]
MDLMHSPKEACQLLGIDDDPPEPTQTSQRERGSCRHQQWQGPGTSSSGPRPDAMTIVKERQATIETPSADSAW